MFDMRGKVAIVTGSTSGIGQGIAQSFAIAGASLVLNGRRPAEEVAEQQRLLEDKYGIATAYHRADMTKPDEITDLIGSTIHKFGRIDVLVNNAGIQHVSAIHEFPPEKWNEIIAVHLTAPFLTVRASIPTMLEQGWGRIINIASAHSSIASPFKSAYVAAKHGLVGLTKVIALEVAERGITCNAICPGYVRTPLVDGQITRQAETRGIDKEAVEQEVFMAVHATRKFTTIEAIGDTATFLCSPAAENITGQEIYMDGGWTAGQAPRIREPAKAVLKA